MMHMQELAEKKDVEYIPGGATQNSIRVAQWVLQSAGATSYFGCIGSDDFGSKMRENATKDGINVRSYVSCVTDASDRCQSRLACSKHIRH
jgi:sugar/nucleoside kinase (ribokinase family)